MDIKQLRFDLAEKNKQVKTMAAKETLTAEELKKWDELLVEMDGIKANLERLERSGALDAFATQPGAKAQQPGQAEVIWPRKTGRLRLLASSSRLCVSSTSPTG